MKLIAISYPELGFAASDPVPSPWVIVGYHVCSLRRIIASVYRLVDDLEHADIEVRWVRMGPFGHPFQEFVCTLVVITCVESRGAKDVTSILLAWKLRSWSSMEIHNDINTQFSAVSHDIVQILEAASWIVLAAIHKSSLIQNPTGIRTVFRP